MTNETIKTEIELNETELQDVNGGFIGLIAAAAVGTAEAVGTAAVIGTAAAIGTAAVVGAACLCPPRPRVQYNQYNVYNYYC